MIDRRDELAASAELRQAPTGCRPTLADPMGFGTTHLALAAGLVAGSYPGGVAWAELTLRTASAQVLPEAPRVASAVPDLASDIDTLVETSHDLSVLNKLGASPRAQAADERVKQGLL